MPRAYWLANGLSLARVPLAGALWLAPGDTAFLLGLFVVAGLTDMTDGFAARHSGRDLPAGVRAAQARLGAWLDPACDKAFMASAALALLYVHRPPLYLIGLVLLRDVLLAGLTLLWLRRPDSWRATHPLTAAWPGKIDTGLQVLALLSLLLYPAAFPLLAWLAGAGGLLAVLHYVGRARRPAT